MFSQTRRSRKWSIMSKILTFLNYVSFIYLWLKKSTTTFLTIWHVLSMAILVSIGRWALINGPFWDHRFKYFKFYSYTVYVSENQYFWWWNYSKFLSLSLRELRIVRSGKGVSNGGLIQEVWFYKIPIGILILYSYVATIQYIG